VVNCHALYEPNVRKLVLETHFKERVIRECANHNSAQGQHFLKCLNDPDVSDARLHIAFANARKVVLDWV